MKAGHTGTSGILVELGVLVLKKIRQKGALGGGLMHKAFTVQV